MLSEEKTKRINSFLKACGATKVVLFGSHARGEET